MKRIRIFIILILLLNLIVSGEIIEKILLEGNEKVSKDTILFYIKSTEKCDF
jgi:hypothetical protein